MFHFRVNNRSFKDFFVVPGALVLSFFTLYCTHVQLATDARCLQSDDTEISFDKKHNPRGFGMADT